MKKILILGSDSMAGHIIFNYFNDQNDFEVYGLTGSEFINEDDAYKIKLKRINPNIIINTLRIVVDACEDSPEVALYLNSYFPKILEKQYINSKTKIIQLSTDCVFSGKRGSYREEDVPDGCSNYSRTKFCGEIVNNKDLTIRTSYIGPNLIDKSEELFDWLLKQKDIVSGFSNAYWNGITTLELAKLINELIILDIKGIYHLASREVISKYELLSLINKKWKLCMLKIKEVNLDNKIDRSLMDTRGKVKIINYEKMFDELYAYMHTHTDLYKHYNI